MESCASTRFSQITEHRFMPTILGESRGISLGSLTKRQELYENNPAVTNFDCW